MPITIKLTFPAGRYHATPWGRHVNEGVHEWPPSPWRLLRSLVAVWKRTSPGFSDEQVKRVLSTLAAPPKFKLPPHRVAHTRHYMPWEKKGPLDRTLVFDTFVAVDRNDPLYIGWPEAELRPDDRSVLATLLDNLSSLGRAEGWVSAELIDEMVELPLGEAAPDDPNPVPVFCLDTASAFDDRYYPKHDLKKLRKGLKPDELLFDCPRWHLCLDTQTIHNEKWPSVPGARWVNYQRPSETDLVTQSRASIRSASKPTVACFLLDGPVLPSVSATVQVAEGLRRAIMSHYQRQQHRAKYGFREGDYLEKFYSRTLSGKTNDGKPLTDHHHAYYLPSADEITRTQIRSVVVFASGGFDDAEKTAFFAPLELHIGDLKVRARLVGLDEQSKINLPIFSSWKEWVSLTPFIGPAHIGTKGRDRYLRKALAREWRRLAASRGFSEDKIPNVEITKIENSEIPPYLRSISRGRSRSIHDGNSRAFDFFRLQFEQPVSGPINLGYGSHFGLGQFVPP